MKLLDILALYNTVKQAEDEIRNQAQGEVVTVGPAKQKLFGKRKRITVLVENDP